jgi:acyl-CoA thioester hydrolase
MECGIREQGDTCRVPLAKIEGLPCYHSETIPDDYLDVMGHMNIRWYMALYDRTGWSFFKSLGLDDHYYQSTKAGVFALSHFIRYYSEIRAGQTVSIRTRLLGLSDKRFHFMHFMVNDSNGQLASNLEGMGTHADLVLRRSTPMPEHIARAFAAKLVHDRGLDWDAPLCGAIQI